MRITSDEEKRKVFNAFHSAGRPIRAIADAYGTMELSPSPENYDSEALLAASKRRMPHSMETARAVMDRFAGKK